MCRSTISYVFNLALYPRDTVSMVLKHLASAIQTCLDCNGAGSQCLRPRFGAKLLDDPQPNDLLVDLREAGGCNVLQVAAVIWLIFEKSATNGR